MNPVNWSPSDVLTYGPIIVAALVTAARQAWPEMLSASPESSTNSRKWSAFWNRLPAALVCISAVCFITVQTGIWPKTSNTPTVEDIYGQTFEGVTVVLDYHVYHHCIFDNVSFRWNGGAAAIVDDSIVRNASFETQNATVVTTLDLLKALKLLGEPRFAENWHHMGPEHFRPKP